MSNEAVHVLGRFCDANSPVVQFGAKGSSEQKALTATLANFFQATMDGVRLKHANDAARILLRREDIDGAVHFRDGVLRKELSGRILYGGQRDHTAHTLTNYVLGWYLFERVPEIRNSVRGAFMRRSGGEPDDELLRRLFNRVWIWASLLHDVGYLLEGGVAALDVRGDHEHVVEGAEYVADYFQHRYWTKIGLGGADHRHVLRGHPEFAPPVATRSLAAIASSLRDVGETSLLLNPVQQSLAAKGHTPASLEPLRSLPRDGFHLWRAHYDFYGHKRLAAIVDKCERAFERLLWSGLSGKGDGLRILDHGVCSGLIQLRYSTHYFLLQQFLAQKECPELEATKSAFSAGGADKYRPYWWWTGVVWGTGAAAVHNLVQTEQGLAFALDDDPIAFLGVLVDVLQDWDRYPVRRGRYGRPNEAEALPMQGIDLDLLDGGGRVAVSVPAQRVEKVCEDLQCLDGWHKLVELQVTPRSQA